MPERHDTDILILGSGGAGLFAALHALEAAPELKVTVVVKGLLGKCGCTRMVQGGYNVALSQGDSVERHFMDTIIGGKWLPHQAIAWKLCETAVVRVSELENEIGCFFDRNPDGSLHHKAFAGQTFDRTVHKGDLTGIEIVSRLMEQVLGSSVERMEEHRAVALIPSRAGDSLAGVLLIDMRRGVFRFVRARAVLMATGGGPTMYRYHTPSGDKSMDGLAMSLRLGLPARDMEMVQFHPTGLLGGDDTRMTGTVLEEGLRGAGGHLLGADGRRFMLGYDELGERGTRDVVSRAIYSEMRKGNTTRRGGVYLSMSHIGPAEVRERFRGMVRRCADCGFDLAAGKVEVVPTAHYFMGGLVCDPETRTGLPGLYVAGEDACMVLGKRAACLRTIGDRNPDPKIAALELELTQAGNSIGMGAMGFVGNSMVIDTHIEVGYCHTGGMQMSVHAFCLASRRACARIQPDGSIEYRTDPQWFTPYMRRETVEWPDTETSRQYA